MKFEVIVLYLPKLNSKYKRYRQPSIGMLKLCSTLEPFLKVSTRETLEDENDLGDNAKMAVSIKHVIFLSQLLLFLFSVFFP